MASRTYLLTTGKAAGKVHISRITLSAGVADFATLLAAWALISNEEVLSITEEIYETTPEERAELALDLLPTDAYGMTGQVFTANNEHVAPFQVEGIDNKMALVGTETIDSKVKGVFQLIGKIDNNPITKLKRGKYFNMGR